MAAYEIKTKKNTASVAQFLNSIEDGQKRKDAKEINKMLRDITGEKPKMWGASIIGYGSYKYKSERSKAEGEWMLIGFSPRKQNISIYIMPGYDDYGALLEKLGPHKHSVSCLYIKRLSDIHIPTLKKLMTRGYKDMKKNPTYGCGS